MNKKRSTVDVIEWPNFDIKQFVSDVPLSLDMPGIFFVEARKRARAASRSLEKLNSQLRQHRTRVKNTTKKANAAHPDDPWTQIIHGVSGIETVFAKTIRDFSVSDVLLVAAAESYVNAIADHVLTPTDAALFDKLSPTGKWLFLPKVMSLDWNPDSSKGDLKEFAAVVARRNKIVHPKKIEVKGTANVQDFIERLRMNAQLADRGISAVGGLISDISLHWRGSYGPAWLQESAANNHPPCFLLGTPEAPARLGRARRPRASGV